MLSSEVVGNRSIITVATIPLPSPASPRPAPSSRSVRFKTQAFVNLPFSSVSVSGDGNKKSSVIHDSLRLLEWDKVCDYVASFAGTSLGREATKAQLWNLNRTYEQSLKLLDETTAAVQILKHGGCSMDFSTVDVVLVKSAIQHARRGLLVDGKEALAIVALLNFAKTLQYNLKIAIKEDADWYKRFMPLTEVITKMIVNQSLIKFIQEVIDEDGYVKDSVSSNLKQARNQVRTLERKIYLLMGNLINDDVHKTSPLEVRNVDGRLCIKSDTDQPRSLKGLLLSSGSGVGSIVEPLFAVRLNDELQQARALVAKVEADVLSKLTAKLQRDLNEIEALLVNIIQLDAINARAIYSLSYGGTCPDITFPENSSASFTGRGPLSGNEALKASHPTEREWMLYLPKAYHPILVWQHHQILQKARKDLHNATAEIRWRKLQGVNMSQDEETDANPSHLEMQVSTLEQAHPVPVDFFIAHDTRVLIITGPNTGGKTICLKTVGLAAMMAKSGLYVLASEPVQIPWFDSIFADVGDEQSLSQSLSTFSGHLKQINDIQAQSTNRSLVLLDEVGAGTNPLEGAALSMSLLESFSQAGALLTVATTHHGELKTLKYCNGAFENACMEFDEVKLKPTYRILWGVPGRSNAINIADRLALPKKVLDNAREFYGTASAEINEVIIDMERFKQDFQEHFNEAQHYLMLSRDLYENLLVTERKIIDHGTDQLRIKMQKLCEAATTAHSSFQVKARKLRASATQPSKPQTRDNIQQISAINSQHTTSDINEHFTSDEKRIKLPKVGDVVHVSFLKKKARVLEVAPSKEEMVVQVGNMKLKLNLIDIETH
ncbi:uncharacterized protein LOC131146093 isoform X2 [Malania oleifera]|uniref:uncharacterized protein LOC131146093 isoform X2 n=1 Tax=Malania oleifera TaxID=397392 RepID=UPI0025AEC1BB|nr:uncharacterized protein LOC131146093 isoform X2 [Malania oleifera]XP_057951373.1 uncharacterized protein LOC131146093 isoform X2 [Malania oleifera]